MLLGEEELCLLSDGQLDYVEDKDGFVLFAQGHAFAGNRQRIYCLEEDDKSVLKKALTADLDSMTDSNEVKSMFLDSSIYRDTYLHPAAYKNGKLYLVGNCFTYYDRPDGTAGPSISTSTGISLAVFDESGLLYFGTYRSSLGSGRVFNSYYHPPVLWFDDDQ